ncbi:MAG TPA: hypothetical protein VG672_05030 [Bryobacteraceae bacterium]|nr:hypothetical protein [Bryobacteraceae bacterium]
MPKGKTQPQRQVPIRKIQSLLEQRIVHPLKDRARATSWLNSLQKSPAGRLLAISIALDLVSDAVDDSIYRDVLRSLPAPAGNPCQEFAAALHKHPEYEGKLLGVSRIRPRPLEEGDHFVRVLEIGTFVKFYDAPRSGRGLRLDEVTEVRQLYFEDGSYSDLGDIREVWSGKNGRVWVLPLRDLNAAREAAAREQPGTPVLDALGIPLRQGFGPDYLPDLVAIHYPPDWKTENPPRQPTAIDADWQSEEIYYISYGAEDGWGRTHSCSGSASSCRERVHGPFAPLNHGFRGEHIGPAKPLASGDLEHVVQEAYRRFERFSSLKRSGHA